MSSWFWAGQRVLFYKWVLREVTVKNRLTVFGDVECPLDQSLGLDTASSLTKCLTGCCFT